MLNIYSENTTPNKEPQFFCVTENDQANTDYDLLQCIGGPSQLLLYITGQNLTDSFDIENRETRVQTCIELNREQKIALCDFLIKSLED